MFLISLVAKITGFISRLFRLGAGVTWAGEISLRLDNSLIKKLSQSVKKGIIIVAGTNGKTTTALMIGHILTKSGFKVIHNRSGANLRNGVAGTLMLNSDFFGRLNCDFAIFEIDEATLPVILEDVSPKIVVLLNLFRDQLDRYGEVDMIAQKWSKALREVSRVPRVSQVSQVSQEENDPILIANADDPLIAFIGEKYSGDKQYFGLNDKRFALEKLSHATDSIYCLNCGSKLNYKAIYLSHFGDWECGTCNLKRPRVTLSSAISPLPGVYNLYNTLAALLTANVLGIKKPTAEKSLTDFKPAFGRQETFDIKGKKIQLFLSKNPAGFNESIRTVLQSRKLSTIMFVLNDRIPDGTDVSWIWDVDFEEIVKQAKNIICSGDRVYDMALRIKYSIQVQSSKFKVQNQDSKLKFFEKLEEALEKGLEYTPKGETLFIFPTYSAMLDIRKILIGRKIL